MHYAAYHGNRRIVRKLIAAGAVVDAQTYGNNNRRAFPFGIGGWALTAAECRRLPCRQTPLHFAVDNGGAIAELLLSDAVAVQDCLG